MNVVYFTLIMNWFDSNTQERVPISIDFSSAFLVHISNLNLFQRSERFYSLIHKLYVKWRFRAKCYEFTIVQFVKVLKFVNLQELLFGCAEVFFFFILFYDAKPKQNPNWMWSDDDDGIFFDPGGHIACLGIFFLSWFWFWLNSTSIASD